MLNIGWFSTGRGAGSRQLLQVANKYIQSGEINGKIIFVFSNREPNEAKESDQFMELVHGYNIPLVCLSSTKFRSTTYKEGMGKSQKLVDQRLEYDREVMKLLQDYTPDICVLAGYMLIVGDEMCRKYNMINLHPAIPGGPTGSWRDVIWNLIDNRARESGIMMHLATPELDRGPVITYCTYPITGKPFDRYWQKIGNSSSAGIKKEEGESNPLFQIIRQHGLSRELPLIVQTLKALCNSEVRIESGQIFDRQGQPLSGYDLSQEVNNSIDIE